MRHIDHTLGGVTRPLSCCSGALFDIYDKFGYTADILDTLKIYEPTAEGWKNTCWLYALLASWGELQRRALGHEPRPMISMEDVRTFALPSEAPGIRNAITDALRQGFATSPSQDPDDEIDEILRAREEEDKKKQESALTAQLISQLLDSFSASVPPTP